MSFKEITYDASTNAIIFRTRKAGQKPLKVPMTGFVPIGAVIPIFSHLTGAYDCTATTAADDSGFVQCNGQTINDTSSPLHGRTIPDVNGSGDSAPAFLRGSTSPSSTKNGSDSFTIATTNLPTHTHGYGTLVNTGASDHSHAKSGGVTSLGSTSLTHSGGSVTNLGSTSLTHTGGSVTNLGSTSLTHSGGSVTNLAGSTGGESSHTHSSALPAHRHYIQARNTGTVSSDHTHNIGYRVVFSAAGPYGDGYSMKGIDHTAGNTGTYNPSGATANHTHGYGGHWSNDNSSSVAAPYGDGVQNTYEDGVGAWAVGGTRTTSAGSNHAHDMGHGHSFTQPSAHDIAHGHGFTQPSAHDIAHGHSFTQPSAHDIAHGHADTIAYAAAGAHNHTISGSTDNGGFANNSISNIPKYLSVKYIMRIK